MKMQIKVYARPGCFYGKVCNSATKDEIDKASKVLEEVVENGQSFVLETANGKVLFGREILQSAVFEIEVTE